MSEDVTYALAAKFSLQTVGLQTAVELATRALSSLESVAVRTEVAADHLGVRSARLASAFAAATPGTTRYFDLFGASTVAMAEHTSAVNAAAEAHARLGTAMKGAGMIAGGAVLTAGGAGILSVLDQAVNKATLLNTTMIGVSQRLTDNSGVRLSGAAQLTATDALTRKATQVGLTSGMSTLDVTNIVQAAEGAGITSQAKLMTMMAPLTNLAEVLKLTKGMDPTQSATVATQFSHIFGAYGDKKIGGVSDTAYMTDLLTRALFVTPNTPTELLNLTSQFIGPLRTLYGSKGQEKTISQSIETAVLLGRLGQETRGGTQFAQIVSRIAGAGRGGVKGLHELQAASGVGSFFDTQGQLTSVPTLIQALASVESKKGMTPRGAEKIFYDAFGTVGTRLAGLLADPTTTRQMGVIATSLGPKGLPSEQVIQQAYNSSRAGQLNQAAKNMESLQIALGTGLVPAMTAVAQAEVAMTRPLVEFAAQHKTITTLATDFAALAGVAAVVSGPILVIGGALKILNVSGALAPAIAGMRAFAASEGVAAVAGGLLDIALSPIVLTIGGVALGVGAAVLAFQHWSTVTSALGALFGWLNGKLHDFLVMVGIAHNSGGSPVGRSGVTTGDANFYNRAHPYAPQIGTGPGHFQAYRGGATWVPDPPKHVGKGGGAGVTVTGPVNINIHPLAHHNATDIAHAVKDILSLEAGIASRRHGSTNVGWDVGYGGI